MNSPPQIPRIPSTTLKVIPPESPSPVTEIPGNATQTTKGAFDADDYVDLGAGRGQQVNHTGRLPCAHLQSRQPQPQPSQHKAVQPQLQTPRHGFPPVPQTSGLEVVNLSQLPEFLMKQQHQQQQQQQQYQQQLQTELPDPLPALQHQPTHKKPAGKQSKVAPPDQSRAFNAEGPTLPAVQVLVEDDLGFLKLKDSPNKPHKLYTQPSDTFEEGKVKLCSRKGCDDFLLHVDKLSGTTGVILNDRFKPDGDRYEDGAHYITVRRLGMGSFGTVDLCVDSESQLQFVRKKLKKTSFHPTEVSVPVKLPHANITHVFGIISNPESVELLMEYAGTALNRYVAKERDLWKDEKKMWGLVGQGFRALAHLDRYGIKHLDIKPENLCVLQQDNGSLVLKLTDFGSSRTPQESLQFVGMTAEYVAPEIAKLVCQIQFKMENWNVSEKDVTGKVDVFAFGLVIMFIYKGYHILQKLITKGLTSYESFSPEQRQVLHAKLLLQLASDSTFITNLIPDECSPDMRELVSRLVEHDHNMRPTASFILQQLAECMDMDGGPVRNTTRDLRRKKIAEPYKGSGKGCKGSGKGRSYTEAGSFRGRQVASKVMDYPMTPVKEMKKLSLSVDAQPVYGVTESHAPITQPSMETESINSSEMIADSPPMINIQACPAHQVNQTRPALQPMHRYATQASMLDVDLSRRRVPSSRTVQSLRPQTLPTVGQELNQPILHASSQLQQMAPESPPTPEPTHMNQDSPAALMPDFAQLFDDDMQ